MIHPDYIIGAVMVVIFAALLKVKINFERNEQAEKKPIFYRPMPPEKLDELAGLLAKQWTDEILHEAGHPMDERPYPLQSYVSFQGRVNDYHVVPSRRIVPPISIDAPYNITKVILPMETDQQKWN